MTNPVNTQRVKRTDHDAPRDWTEGTPPPSKLMWAIAVIGLLCAFAWVFWSVQP